MAASFPPCDGRVRRIVVAGRGPIDEPPCPRCGGSHLLVIEEVIVMAVTDVDDAGAAADRGDW
jgi:hypothetical protein